MKACLVALLLLGAFADYGVDISSPVDSGTFSCLVSNGYTFTIVRGYCSYGAVDPNAVSSIQNAYAGGMSHVDAYLFPCFSCGNPAGQVDALISAIAGTGYGMIWLDIEVYQWGDTSDNINFIQGLIDELNNQGASFGIYTNYYNWQSITGLWTGPADSGIQLWWAYYDGEADFNDFSSFADWSAPNIKQYSGGADVCGANVDQNWYPD